VIKNYFKTAWRNLWKNKFYTSINILGLAIGLAVGLIILLWVKDELSYDRFHKQADNIYHVVAHVGSGSTSQAWGGIPAPIGVYGKKELPEIKESVRIIDNNDYSVFRYGDKQFDKTRSAYVDPSFFTLFDFKLSSGNAAKPFPDNNSIIITKETAKKYFGNDNPVGKIITADNKDNYTVQGVMEDFPENSSLQYDMLFTTDVVAQKYSPNDYWKSMNEDWGNYDCITFFQLRPDASLTAVESKITKIHRSHHEDDICTIPTEAVGPCKW
jgi:putative ABC transport system permease protein